MLDFHQYGNGFPILCLHGWGFDHSIWQCLKTVWPGEWQMITVDLPGHGQTPAMPMESFTTRTLQQLPRVFSIIGWSLGGLYAFQLVKQAAFRIRHLAAVATSPFFIRQSGWPGIEPAVLTRFYRQYARDPFKTLHNFIELQFPDNNSKPKCHYSPVLPSDAKLGLTLLQECDFRTQLQANTQDMSFLLGQQDAIVPVSLAKALPEHLNVADVSIINRCGHMPFLTHSDLFISHLKERVR